MARRLEHRLGLGDLHHPAQVHHGHPVRQVAHQPQVVRHEQDGQVQPFLKLQQQVDHLSLHRHVKGRDQLVGDQALGFQRQRPRDADTLPLPAGKFMRQASGGLGRQAHQ